MIKDTLKDKVDRIAWKASVKIDHAKQDAKELGKWALNHPGESIALLTAGGAVVGGVNKFASKVVKRHDEKIREKEYYDPQTWNWVQTKRKLTSKEKVELSQRRNNGESVTQILDSMRLLKR